MRTLTENEPICTNCGRPASECRAAEADEPDDDLDDDELDAQADAILADLKAGENGAADERFWAAVTNTKGPADDGFDPDDVLEMPPGVTDVIANERRTELEERGRRRRPDDDPPDDDVTANWEDDILDVPPIDYAALAAEQAKADRRRR